MVNDIVIVIVLVLTLREYKWTTLCTLRVTRVLEIKNKKFEKPCPRAYNVLLSQGLCPLDVPSTPLNP